MKYKVDFVREQFPAFSEPSLKRWLHFENAGGSYMAGVVMERLHHYDVANRVQPYASYPASKVAGEMMDAAYSTLAAILNVDEDWVHIGPSTTANTYTIANAMRGYLQSGDNIVVSNQDHEANSGYWRRLADMGVEVREWQVNKEGLLEPETLWSLLDERTKFVAFPHVSNIIGQINPVTEIAKELRSRNVLSIVDGVSYAPHAWPDISALGTDIYFFSTYKTYGSHQGVMVMRPELAKALPNQAHEFNGDRLRYKFNPAGPQYGQLASIAALGDYIETVYDKHKGKAEGLTAKAQGLSELQRKHETKLLDQFLEGFEEVKSLRILGTQASENRVPTISLYSEETRGAKLAKQLRKRGIMASGGDFYAPRVLRALDIDPDHGVLRLSFVHYTSAKDIEKLLKALRKIDD